MGEKSFFKKKFMALLRSFISINICDQLIEKVTGIQKEFNRYGIRIKWIGKNNLHITLKFIGNIDRDSLPAIKTALANGVSSISAFKIELKGLGVFPNIKNPRIIWIGATGNGTKKLAYLKKTIESKFNKIGILGDNKKFYPHISIGRIKLATPRVDLKDIIEKYKNIEVGDMAVNSLFLMESKLNQKGATYSVLSEIKLY